MLTTEALEKFQRTNAFDIIIYVEFIYKMDIMW
jgi:hypothetical protein